MALMRPRVPGAVRANRVGARPRSGRRALRCGVWRAFPRLPARGRTVCRESADVFDEPPGGQGSAKACRECAQACTDFLATLSRA